jgi:RNA polymerase sigma-70 factor (ECF subfamily)
MNATSDDADVPANRSLIEAIERQFADRLIRYARIFVVREDLAEEIVQETFLQLCQLSNIPDEPLIGPWLFRVCRNRAIDFQRKEKRMKPESSNLLQSAISNSRNPAEMLSQQETVSRVQLLLAGLTENQQEVVRLKFQNGFSYRQIAEVTGLSISNVGVQLHEAILRIRSKLSSEN